ncbi:MAG TPA: glycosyltransferase family 2 protein [Solirubrobacteraceae bacterium]|nr:glycosyltransferase family 2 protein [Solirubrobacteraceae bacterium]
MTAFPGAALSIVSPVYGNADTLESLTRQLFEYAEPLFGSVEIIFVNDGSPDDSQAVLAGLAREDPRVRVVRLVRNFGQHVAVLAGLRRGRGDYVLLIDADLEDPPSAIPALAAKLAEGYEVAVGVRPPRRLRGLRGLLSAAYIRLFNWLSDYPILENATTMRLMTRRYADYLTRFEERPFIAGMSAWIGLPIGEVPVEVPGERQASGYTMRQLLRHARIGLLGFSTKPLRLASVAGVLLCFGSIAYAVAILAGRLLFGGIAPGFTTVVVLFTFLLGMQFVVLGVIGEYLSETFLATRRRPEHLVYDTLNLED